jgi:hypothetical protein
MINAFRYHAVTLVLVMAAAIAPATAQLSFPWSTSPPPPPAAKPATSPGPSIVGKWAGQLTPGGDSPPINYELTVTAAGGETKYPELDCTGKLKRLGSSKTYVSFVEIIIKGRADKGGKCRDGTVTIARQGDSLSLVWFGSFKDSVVLAYGVLAKK